MRLSSNRADDLIPYDPIRLIDLIWPVHLFAYMHTDTGASLSKWSARAHIDFACIVSTTTTTRTSSEFVASPEEASCSLLV